VATDTSNKINLKQEFMLCLFLKKEEKNFEFVDSEVMPKMFILVTISLPS
jgi:hypothetical protein